MNSKAKKVALIGMLCAIAYVITVVGRVPIVLFLKYEAKDVIIAMGGFMFGPLTSLIVSVIVSLIEMITISDTGFIGLVMNILSSCGFACTAAIIYKKIHTLKGAIVGLVAGCLVSTALMLLWNYLVTPIYMNYPREAVAELLIPYFLPFNLGKNGVNAVLTLLIYKPVVRGLRKAKLLAPTKVNEKANITEETNIKKAS